MIEQTLIAQFLHHYKAGFISAKPGTSAAAVLDRLAVAMDAVKPPHDLGRPEADNHRLAELAYVLKYRAGLTWEQVADECHSWSVKNGRPILSKGSLQNLVRKHGAAVEGGLELAALLVKEHK